MRAIATEACRQASNTGPFLERVERETGLHFDVITAREEAALVLESCAPLLNTGHRRALLFDIGGGSTELVWVRINPDGGSELAGYVSLPVGVVTLADRFGTRGFDPEGFKAMVDDVTERLRPFEAVHRIGQEIRQGGVRLLGTSGTVTTLAGIVLALKQYSRPRSTAWSSAANPPPTALAELRAMGRAGLAAHPCVGRGPCRFRAPGLRHLRGDPVALAGARDHGGRSRPARRPAAAPDPRRPRPHRPAPAVPPKLARPPIVARRV